MGGQIKGNIRIDAGTLNIGGHPIITGNGGNGAIFLHGGSINLSGSPTIEVTDDSPGINISSGNSININGELKLRDPITIALQGVETETTYLFAEMEEESYASADNFEAAVEGYTVVKNGKKLYLTKQETHEHDDKVFTPWLDSENLPTEPGKYYLTGNVKLTDTWNVPTGKTNICLNGNTISTDYIDVLNVGDGADLTIFDCKNAGEIKSGYEVVSVSGGSFTLKNGTIKNDTNDNVINVSSGGTVTIENGTVSASYGRAINGDSDSNIIIKGGTISGSQDSGISASGRIEISGGEISGVLYYGVDAGSATEFILSGNPNISVYGGSGDIHISTPITINEPLTGGTYSIYMDTPGIFATGANAAEYADKFKPSDTLAAQYYSVIVNSDGNLELAQHKHEGVEGVFKPWTKKDSLPTTSGSYYLTDSVTLSSTWSVPTDGETNLCLNGKSITNPDYVYPLINIGADTKLNIFDEKENEGKIENNTDNVINIESGELTVNGGTISSNSNIIYISNGQSGTVTINGGNIISEKMVPIYVNEATVNIKGGNVISKSSSSAIQSYDGSIKITGGTITSPSDSCSWAVYSINDSIEITGGNIKGGTRYAVYVSRGTLEISGNANIETTIPESVGVFAYNTKFKLFGSPTISGEKADIQLDDSTTKINIDGILGNEVPYIIDMSTPGVFTKDANGKATVKNFTPSAELQKQGYEVTEQDGELALTLKTYTITYLSGGTDVTGTIEKDTKTHGQSVNLSENKFKRLGYTQVGWAEKENGVKTYEFGAEYKEDKDITLYPAWEKNVITLSSSEADLKVDEKTTITATVSPETADYKTIEWSVTGDGVIEFTEKDGGKSVDITALKAGTVTLKASIDEGETTAKCEINVTKTDSTVTLSAADTVTYGGTLTLSANIAKNTAGISLMALDRVEFFNGGTSLGSAEVKEGKAELTVKVTKGNNFKIGANTITAVYGGSISLNGKESNEITVTVEKRELTPSINGDNFEKAYDGDNDASKLGLSIKLEGVLDGDNVNASGNFTFNSKDVNEAKTITANNITLSGDDAGYYTLSETSITHEGTISPAPLKIPDKEYIYDGEISREIEIDGVNGETVTARLTAYSKNAGTYNYNINRAGGFYTAGLSSTNYSISTAGTLTINKRLAGIEWQKTTSFVYDGEEKTVTAEWKNKVENDDAELKFTNNVQTEVGDYTATVEITGTDSANYTLEGVQTEQDWKITTAGSVLTLSAKGETVTYGEKVSLTATVKRSETNGIMMMSAAPDEVEFFIGENSIGSGTVSYTYGSSGTAVLELSATSANHFKAGENIIRAEYGGSGNLSGSSAGITITVGKKPVNAEIIGTTTSKVYDGTNEITGLSLQLNGIEYCDKEYVQAEAESYTFNSADVETADTITANGAELSGAQAENYTLTVDTIEGTITPFLLEIQSYSFTYDGDNVFEILLNGIPGETLSAKLTAASQNAGTYIYGAAENGYTIELDSSNYAVNTADPLKIDPLTAKIEWQKETLFDYDGTEKSVSAEVTNAAAGDTFNIVYENNAATDVGKYTAEITSLGNDNYTLGDNTSLNWSIKESELLIDELPTASAITYGQSLSDSTLTGGIVKNGEITVTGKFEWENGNEMPTVSDSKKTNYTVKFIPDDKNYSDITAEITIEVNKKELVPSVLSADDKTYDGTTAANGAIELSGAVNGEEPTATGIFDFTDKNAGENKSVNVSGIELDDDWSENYYLSVTSFEKVETTAKISPRTAKIKWQETTSFDYDGTEKSVAAEVTNAVAGDTFNIVYENNAATDAGKYTAEITSLGNDNYTLDGAENVKLSWEISPVDREETNVTINYFNETLSTSSDMEYSIDGATWLPCTENMSVTAFGWKETESLTVKFRYAADNNHNAGAAQTAVIPARPEAPDISKVTVTKTQDSITVTEISGCEYSIDGAAWQNSGKFSGLTAGTEYTVQIRTKAAENAFASFAADKEIVTSDTSSGKTELKTGETVETENGSITNDGNKVELEDNDGNKTTVTLPDGASDSVEIDESGNVQVPDGSIVQTGDKTFELPDGGTISPDGTITADKVVAGNTTVSGEEVTVDKDGNITVSENGTVQTGDTTVELPNGGTISPDGTITADKVVTGNTTVSGDEVTVDKDGNITVSENGTVQTGDTTVELPNGGTVKPDGTITAKEVVTGGKTVSGEEVTVDKDGNITVSENGTVQTGDTTVELPDGGTVKPDGTITADKVVVGDKTISGEEVTVDKDGNITVSENGTVQTGDTTVELPDGGTVKPDGTITADKVVAGNTEVSGEEVTVDKDGNITVSENGTVQTGDMTVTLPDGGTVKPDGTITADKVVAGNTTVSGDEVTADKDGNITVSGSGTVQTGDTTVELPNGGTVKPDGTITADKVVTDNTTVSGDEVTVTPNGNITLPNGGIVHSADESETVIGKDGSIKNSEVSIEPVNNIDYYDENNEAHSLKDGYIVLDIEPVKDIEIGSDVSVIAAYDIRLLYNGKIEVQPNGAVKVTINAPANADGTERVLHLNGNSVEDMNAAYDSETKTFSFETNHFSVYVIAEKEVSDEPETKPSISPTIPDRPSAAPAATDNNDSEDVSSGAEIISSDEKIGMGIAGNSSLKNILGYLSALAIAAAAAIIAKKKRQK